jgi:hypothetical protein
LIFVHQQREGNSKTFFLMSKAYNYKRGPASPSVAAEQSC